MSKNLIYQYYITRPEEELLVEYGEDYQNQIDAMKVGTFKMKKYADSIGADYFFADEEMFLVEKGELPNRLEIFFERLRIIYDESFDKYDKVLFADCDVVPDTHDNIFDECIGDVCGVYEHEWGEYYASWEEYQHLYDIIHKKYKKHGVDTPKMRGHLPIFNCGMYVMTREGRLKCRELLDDWREWYDVEFEHQPWVLNDQFWLSCQLMKYPQIVYQNLDRRWNGRSLNNTHYQILVNKFIHYHYQAEKHRLVNHWKHEYNEESDIPISP